MYTICTILVFKIAKHAISTLAPRRKKRINRRKAKGGQVKNMGKKCWLICYYHLGGGGYMAKYAFSRTASKKEN